METLKTSSITTESDGEEFGKENSRHKMIGNVVRWAIESVAIAGLMSTESISTFKTNGKLISMQSTLANSSDSRHDSMSMEINPPKTGEIGMSFNKSKIEEQNVNDLKGNVNDLKRDVSDLKGHYNDLKQDVDRQSSNLHNEFLQCINSINSHIDDKLEKYPKTDLVNAKIETLQRQLNILDKERDRQAKRYLTWVTISVNLLCAILGLAPYWAPFLWNVLKKLIRI